MCAASYASEVADDRVRVGVRVRVRVHVRVHVHVYAAPAEHDK